MADFWHHENLDKSRLKYRAAFNVFYVKTILATVRKQKQPQTGFSQAIYALYITRQTVYSLANGLFGKQFALFFYNVVDLGDISAHILRRA